MKRHEIKKNQIYKQRNHDFYIVIGGKKKDKWFVKVLTDKTNVYAGTHTLSDITIWKRFELQ